MRKLTAILAATAAPAALAGMLLGTAGQASAATAPAAATVTATRTTAQAPKVVIAHTHRVDVPDTTSVETGHDTPNGPQWATDNLQAVYTATPVAGHPGTWNLRIDEAGTYKAVANPSTGAPMTASGPLAGWLKYQVSSTVAPSAKYLPAKSPGTMTTGQIITELFGGQGTVSGGGSYSFWYLLPHGQIYTQQG